MYIPPTVSGEKVVTKDSRFFSSARSFLIVSQEKGLGGTGGEKRERWRISRDYAKSASVWLVWGSRIDLREVL